MRSGERTSVDGLAALAHLDEVAAGEWHDLLAVDGEERILLARPDADLHLGLRPQYDGAIGQRVGRDR